MYKLFFSIFYVFHMMGSASSSCSRSIDEGLDVGISIQLKSPKKEVAVSTTYSPHSLKRRKERKLTKTETDLMLKNGFRYENPNGDGTKVIFSKDKTKWMIINQDRSHVITVIRDNKKSNESFYIKCLNHMTDLSKTKSRDIKMSLGKNEDNRTRS